MGVPTLFNLILSFLTAAINPVFKFLGAIQDTKKTQVVEEGTVAVAAIEGQAQVQTKWWFAALIPPMLALPAIPLTWKLVVWDTLLGWGSTPPLGTTINTYYFMVMGFYFLHVLGNQR